MVGWHHQLNGHEFEQALGVGEGYGSLTFCSPCGCKEQDMTERLNTYISKSWDITITYYHEGTIVILERRTNSCKDEMQ